MNLKRRSRLKNEKVAETKNYTYDTFIEISYKPAKYQRNRNLRITELRS